jgi:hypothetical protein
LAYSQGGGTFEPPADVLEHLDLQGTRPFLLGWMKRPNPLENLTHDGRFGGIGKTVLDVPAGDCDHPVLERVDGQCCGVVRQVASHRIHCGGQKALPVDFEVTQRRCVALARIFAICGVKGFVKSVHGRYRDWFRSVAAFSLI